jgi:DNA-binding response OmpR family regulator
MEISNALKGACFMNRYKTTFNILIVDDMPVNIKLLDNILQRDGYVIFAATGGRQAIDMARRKEFDLILLDIMMPGMDGYHVCRRLKSESRSSDTPVIFITAKIECEDIVRGFEAGAVDYVTKPFNAAELLARVQTHLDLKHAKKIIQDQAEELIWTNKHLMKKNRRLEKALEEIETLKGLLPVCCNCKKIRLTEAGIKKKSSWVSLEAYLHKHTAVDVTHSICPECMATLYPDLVNKE